MVARDQVHSKKGVVADLVVNGLQQREGRLSSDVNPCFCHMYDILTINSIMLHIFFYNRFILNIDRIPEWTCFRSVPWVGWDFEAVS